MGCAASTPAPEPTKLANPQKVSDEEMQAVRQSLSDAAAKSLEAPTTRQATFKRKFDGFKAGGGSKHNVRRAKDMRPEAVAEREKINAAIAKKKADRDAELSKMNPLNRNLSRGGDLLSSGKNVLVRMPTVSLGVLARMPSRGAGLVRQLTRGSSGSSSGSFFRSFNKNQKSAKDINERGAAEAAEGMQSGVHDHGAGEGSESRTSQSNKHARFADPPPELSA